MATVMLSIDEPAPNFTLPDQNGVPVELNSFRGKWVVLYFYPKDDTSGCTQEAIQFSRLADELFSSNVVIVGVSPDSVESHFNFEKKHGLKFKLLSDTEHVALEKYGAWHLKTGLGKQYWGVVRATYLIDPTGIVRRIWRDVQANGHAAIVKSIVTSLLRETAE